MKILVLQRNYFCEESYMFRVGEAVGNQMKNVQTMLAVILTKSFTCLCFVLKCTYPYFSVYLNCVFGTVCVRLPTSSLLSKGPS